MLLSEGIECLVIVDSTRPSSSASSPPTLAAQTTESAAAETPSPWIGLFDVRPTLLPAIHVKTQLSNSVLGCQRLSYTRRNSTHTLT